ncbi:citrate lyase subunit beta / citryl-CoA lyase [Cohaesibacter sp. ES.047]|uniref:aldolase/citrate lyase family protein n=1 Tax=Cohaesibacter sp. ES.047 TaxID=1798205 RepID=UPI000BB793CA|nr:aldolase/citrate lyase family protein [Cohaesibacter sp. ES.047]SNY94165.1 citrate lyase subunit beta / citryl-CoA lyase [Cohaesibacter sp. ES.047]
MRTFLPIRLSADTLYSELESAITSKADALILSPIELDLDAMKGAICEIRTACTKLLGTEKHPHLYIQIDARADHTSDEDISKLVETGPDGVLVTNCTSGTDITAMDVRLGAAEAIANVPIGTIDILAVAPESAEAIFGLETYQGSSPRLKALIWDADKIAAAIGAKSPRDETADFTPPCLTARSLCLFGAAAAGVASIDTGFPASGSPAALKREAMTARRDGFTGKIATNEQQVAVLNSVFGLDQA